MALISRLKAAAFLKDSSTCTRWNRVISLCLYLCCGFFSLSTFRTGGAPEEIEFDDEEGRAMIDSGELWRRLLSYRKEQLSACYKYLFLFYEARVR